MSRDTVKEGVSYLHAESMGHDVRVTMDDALKQAGAVTQGPDGALVGPNGEEVSGISKAEQSGLQQAFSGQFSDAVYDGSSRLISFKRAGVPHTITYPTANQAVISNDTGAVRTVFLDGSGRVTSFY